MSGVKLIRDSLDDLQFPKYADSIWVAPFELLTGAAYALLAAERHGYSQRDHQRYQYQGHVREKIAALIAEEEFTREISDRDVFEYWQSGFYFNSATNRIVWAAERLITTLAAIDCTCGQAAAVRVGITPPRFGEVWNAASRRLEHLGSEHQQDLEHTHVLLVQMSPEHFTTRRPVFNPDAVLTMLQHDFRWRHSLVVEADAAKQHSNGRMLWSSATPALQFQTVASAFALACRAYNELVAWHVNARDSAACAMGALA